MSLACLSCLSCLLFVLPLSCLWFPPFLFSHQHPCLAIQFTFHFLTLPVPAALPIPSSSFPFAFLYLRIQEHGADTTVWGAREEGSYGRSFFPFLGGSSPCLVWAAMFSHALVSLRQEWPVAFSVKPPRISVPFRFFLPILLRRFNFVF